MHTPVAQDVGTADAGTFALTEAQQRAVTHAGGPLIVLAGPGTGKTRVIVHRIAHMVNERGIKPETIVAMTFTVKAAAELRQRLSAMVGQSVAARINAHTIHGFGYRLLRRFGDMLGMPGNWSLIDAAQTRAALRGLIAQHDLFLDRRAEGLAGLVDQLARQYARLAELGITPRRCEMVAREWGERIALGPSAHGGAEDESTFEAERERARHFADAAKGYRLYTNHCWERGWVGFGDFVLLPIRLLEEKPAALAMCRGDYRAFIVDEFQDCNVGQISLLRLLAGGANADKAEVCVVGDDDQAIYSFRGADEAAFTRFKSVWPTSTVIELGDNFRSQRPLIQVANDVISRAQRRFKADKQIRFPASAKEQPARVEAIKLENDFQDGDVMAAMLRTDFAEHERAGTPRLWSSYAIIARSRGDLDRAAAALSMENIPFESPRVRGVLDDPGVEDVLAWVEWLIDPSATWAARRILARPPFLLRPEIVTQWELRYKAQATQFEGGRPGVSDPGHFHEWLAKNVTGTASDTDVSPAVLRPLAMRGELEEAVRTLRADEAVMRIISATDPAHAELLEGRGRARRVMALIALLGLARDKQTRLDPPGDLAQFWAYYQELSDAGQLDAACGLEEALDREGEEEREGVDHPLGRVQLLTAHASKGLEFDTVFVTRVTPSHGFGASRAQGEEDALPDGLVERLDERTAAERSRDEERRLFYVACTRAKRRLVLLSKWNKSPSGSTHFLEELVRTNKVELPIALREVHEVFSEAAATGLSVLAQSAMEAAMDAAGSPQLRGQAERLRELLERQERGARLEAASALDAASRADLSEEAFEASRKRLTGALAGVAAIAALRARRPLPAWLAADAGAKALAERAAQVGAGAAAGPGGAHALLRPMTAPLTLSYSALSAYERCPRCFYLNTVLRLPEADTFEVNVGNVVHEALKTFMDRYTLAQSEGETLPGREVLQEIGRAAYFKCLGRSTSFDRTLAQQVEAQLNLFFDRMLSAGDHVLETERTLRFEYVLDGLTHNFVAKIDRLDLAPDGAYRVIDYKTGRASKALTEPKPTDLQMGIYALALEKSGLVDETPVRGTAEYWVLSTGERGVIDLGKLNRKKVVAAIDEAVRGMLAGEFPAGKDCDRSCRIFDL